MRNLGIEFNTLRANYREIFLSVVSEIESDIADLPKNDVIKYLSNRLKCCQQSYVEMIESSKSTGKCVCCGLCCRFAVSEFSYEELQDKANNGDNFASQFISVFIPYDNIEQVLAIYPEYVQLLMDNKEVDYYFYHCPKVTSDNKCSDYENRPQICRDFPDNPLHLLPKTCGFCDWKLKLESVSLKLNAETEIINFYIDKIKEFE